MSRRSEGGQATVELVLVLPVVVLLVMAVLQVGLVARAELMTIHASREGARVAAVGADPAAVRTAVIERSGFEPDRVSIDVASEGELVTVVVRYRQGTDLALIGPLVGDVSHVAQTTMRREDR